MHERLATHALEQPLRVTRRHRRTPPVQDRLQAAEARQKALVDEVNHRVKNTLATVQALAHYTLRGAGVSAAVREDFEGRLFALSSVHNQLARECWAGAELGLVIHDLLLPYDLEERVYLNGSQVWLPPKLAVTLAMAVQELLTNAVRHGALSVSGGHVTVDWRIAVEEGEEILQLDWQESGGPVVQAPAGRGFGSALLDHAVRDELGGALALEFAADGLHCRMKVPLPSESGG